MPCQRCQRSNESMENSMAVVFCIVGLILGTLLSIIAAGALGFLDGGFAKFQSLEPSSYVATYYVADESLGNYILIKKADYEFRKIPSNIIIVGEPCACPFTVYDTEKGHVYDFSKKEGP